MRTVPVNQSAGPLPEGCDPFRLISIFYPFTLIYNCSLKMTFSLALVIHIVYRGFDPAFG
jgi:hypothetical protein